jgi:general secretion pathway protein J
MTPRRPRSAGFTLIELIAALVLLALMSSVIYSALSLAGRAWDGGEAKATQVSEMRQTHEFLREELTAGFPLRLKKVADYPLLFTGERDELRYTASLPTRVAEGGVLYFRLALARVDDRTQLVVERLLPDPQATQNPDFQNVEHSVLADGIAELKISYFGRDPGAALADAPSWRDRWDDRQRLPLLVRIDVRPKQGPAWPPLVVEPRRAPEAGCNSYDAQNGRCTGVS